MERPSIQRSSQNLAVCPSLRVIVVEAKKIMCSLFVNCISMPLQARRSSVRLSHNRRRRSDKLVLSRS
jgi:hypothetical protein